MRRKLLLSAACLALAGGSALMACEGHNLVPVPRPEQPTYQSEPQPEVYAAVPRQTPTGYTYAGAGGVLLAGGVICAVLRKV